ncbi:hypothetical protein P154DRAFT_558122 [Amniculicola lignicola CBS 123094]|uniref:Uncharacterized protein n=1 Tax=Amniculicola lignicola CBS 123094 TaxID=1392246 RepID=A0A6A5X4E2_9PLEO|nr:hypothetical protein P154DRAFT_558122 [Amniculicola lignicola CBS 123094]
MRGYLVLLLAVLASLVSAIPTAVSNLSCGSLVSSNANLILLDDPICHAFGSPKVEDVTVSVGPDCICAFSNNLDESIFRDKDALNVGNVKSYRCTSKIDFKIPEPDTSQLSLKTRSAIGEALDTESVNLQALGIQSGDTAQIADIIAGHRQSPPGSIMICAEPNFGGGPKLAWPEMGLFDNKIQSIICYSSTQKREVEEASRESILEPVEHLITPSTTNSEVHILSLPDSVEVAAVNEVGTAVGDILICVDPNFSRCEVFNALNKCMGWGPGLSSFIQPEGLYCYWHELDQCNTNGGFYLTDSLASSKPYARLGGFDDKLQSVQCRDHAYRP